VIEVRAGSIDAGAEIAGTAEPMVAPLTVAYALVMSSVTMSVDIAEFVEIVRSSDAELRQRYGLPTRCDPMVSAMRAPGHRVKVSITCAGALSGGPPEQTGEQGPPARP
jgi:hypothetical protein